MITLEEFKKGKIAINTRTQEEYDNLMRFFDSENDICWCDYEPVLEARNFPRYGEYTCIELNFGTVKSAIRFAGRQHYKSKGYKIITPNELQEYNEFMGKEEKANVIFTAPQDGYYYIKNGKFIKEEETQYLKLGDLPPKEPEYLNIGEAINYMLESPDNVVERSLGYFKFHIRYNNGKFEEKNFCDKNWRQINDRPFYKILQWKKIRKYIEPKQKTLKELIENKEEFSYDGRWYSFNKDGAIINKTSAKAISIELIKEILTKTN